MSDCLGKKIALITLKLYEGNKNYKTLYEGVNWM